MKVEFLAKFSKDLDKIENVQIKKKVVEIINDLETADNLAQISNVKKIISSDNAYRIKVGDYRIGFFFEKGVIELARFVHRKDIYKVFP